MKNTSRSWKGRKWTRELRKTSKMILTSNLFRRLVMSMSRVSCRKLVAIRPVKKKPRTLNSRWTRRLKNRRDKQRRIRRKSSRMAVICPMSSISSNTNKTRIKFWRPLMHRHPKARKPKVWWSLPVTINNYNSNRSLKTPTLRSNHNRRRARPKSRRKSNNNYKRSKRILTNPFWRKCNPWSSARVKLNCRADASKARNAFSGGKRVAKISPD